MRCALLPQTEPFPDMDSLQAFAEAKLAALEAKSLKRTLVETRRLDGLWIERDGRRLLSFAARIWF